MKQALIAIRNGINYLRIKVGALAADRDYTLPGEAPGTDQVLKTGSDDPYTLEFAPYNSGSGSASGTVTSVGVALNGDLYNVSGSPVTTAGTITADLKDQAANTFLGGGSGGDPSEPSFRELEQSDIPSLNASKIGSGKIAFERLPTGKTSTTVAVGNDSRFHNQNTDTGTSNPTFALDTENGGVVLQNEAGVLRLRNAANTDSASIVVKDITVLGEANTGEWEVVEFGDPILDLNATYEGADPLDIGLQFKRGTLAPLLLINKAGTSKLYFGLVGSEKQVALTARTSVTENDLQDGKFTWNHDLNSDTLIVSCWLPDQEQILLQPKIINNNEVELDFADIEFEGSAKLMAVG